MKSLELSQPKIRSLYGSLNRINASRHVNREAMFGITTNRLLRLQKYQLAPLVRDRTL
jgi:hypothetical protein